MHEDPDDTIAIGRKALGRAMHQSRQVKVKAQAVAEELGSNNLLVAQRIAGGETTVSAEQALAAGADAEVKVQECADDLDGVTGSLAVGIENLRRINVELAGARRVLTRTNEALAVAREEEKSARLRALHDATTGLPNRELFDDRLAHALSLAARHDWTLAVMFIDLDGFKAVNDTHGHAAGDGVLVEVAKRLVAHCRHEDSVCRNGGDEFLYLLVNPQGPGNIGRIAAALAANIAHPIDADGVPLVVKPSIGIAVFPQNGSDGSQLVRNADAAMYHAKRGGQGHAFCDPPASTRSLF